MAESIARTSRAKKISLGVGGAFVELPIERVGWANPLEFLLSCIGYAVGIGNVWRFPYLVYRNGGGAFLIPFILMLITMGLPIFFMELSIGQYTAVGPVESFRRMAPAFHGLGFCTLVVISFVTIYYMVLVGWTLFYTFASFSSKLAWAYCDNEFNTNDCWSGLQDIECQENNHETIFYNKSCSAISDVCAGFGYMNGGNVTHCFNENDHEPLRKLYKRILSSEEYFSDYVLGVRRATWENFGGIRWELVGCLSLGWIICYLCLIKGVQTVGKIVYFTALFPYFVLIALLIRGVTLEGASDGALWFITPKWSTLLEANVWGDAASQIFYSLGIGCGSLVTLSSFSTFSNNCHRDAIIVTLTNLFTSIFAGFVIFSVMGYLARQMHLPIEDVVQSGTGLAFIVYPEAVVRMPLPNLWAILFFFMLFILGLGSQSEKKIEGERERNGADVKNLQTFHAEWTSQIVELKSHLAACNKELNGGCVVKISLPNLWAILFFFMLFILGLGSQSQKKIEGERESNEADVKNLQTFHPEWTSQIVELKSHLAACNKELNGGCVVRISLPNLSAILFFFMLFILGLGSQFAGVQAINTAILDVRPNLRKHESFVILGICACGWILGLPMVFDGGIYLYTLMDWNTASWAILLIGFLEVTLPAWCYGCNKYLGNIAEMEMPFGCILHAYWWLSWILLAPITALGVFGYQMYTYKAASYGNYEFPTWANAIGILIGLSTLVPLPIFFVYRVWKGPRDRSLFRPTKDWGPANKNIEESSSSRNGGRTSLSEKVICTEL